MKAKPRDVDPAKLHPEQMDLYDCLAEVEQGEGHLRVPHTEPLPAEPHDGKEAIRNSGGAAGGPVRRTRPLTPSEAVRHQLAKDKSSAKPTPRGSG